MPRKKIRKTRDINAKLQLDGRPWSLTEIRPTAIVSKQAIQRLIAPLDFPLPEYVVVTGDDLLDVVISDPAEVRIARELELIRGIELILQPYLGELLRREKTAAHAEAITALGQIAKKASRLVKHLANAPTDPLSPITQTRWGSLSDGAPPKFDFLHLAPGLCQTNGARCASRA